MPRCAGSFVTAVALAAAVLPAAARAAGPAPPGRVVFMEPAGGRAARDDYRIVDDPDRLRELHGWLENDTARWALDLHDAAWRVMADRGVAPDRPLPYHIALVPKGNHAAIGFRLLDGEGTATDHSRTGYIKLDPSPRGFSSTILHETAHVALMILNGGARRPGVPVACIPHTTAALTDRWTAFNEGFAIHFETLVAHLDQTPDARQRFRHDRLDFSGSGRATDEYFRPAADLRTYSQSVARYTDVRDNTYAFASAHQGADYLRVQLERSRDYAELRNANQLLQSEGFHASFFYALAVREDMAPDRGAIDARHQRILATLAEMFASRRGDPAAPHLLDFAETYATLYAGEVETLVDVLLDLSHGVFVDADAERMWREHYLAAVRLDLDALQMDAIQDARARWRSAVREDPGVLRSRLGPQLRCVVPDEQVLLVAFGFPRPLAFDVNTVQRGIMRLVPGITEDEVTRWIAARNESPFAHPNDFAARAGLEDDVLAALRWMP